MRRFPRACVVALFLVGGSSCAAEPPVDLPLLETGAESMTVLSPGDGSLWDVRDVLEADGVYWVLKASPPFLHVFDERGREVANFGTAGEGPGELRYPRALWPGDAGGAVTVWDAGSRSALTFSTDGRLLSSQGMPRLGGMRADIETVTFGHPFRLFRESGATVLGQFDSGVNRGSDLWNGRLVRVDDNGSDEPRTPVGDIVVDFAEDLAGAAGRTSPQAPGLVPVPLWDGCPDGRIAVLDPIALSLHLLGPGAGEAEAIRLPWEPATLRTTDKFSYLRFQIEAEARGEGADAATIDRVAESAFSQAEDYFPTEAPAGVDLKCAPGHVWIQEFDGDSHPLGYGPRWHTVRLDGTEPRFARVSFPPGFQPVRVSNSGMLGVVTDSVSLQRLAHVDLPPELR